MAPTGDLWNLFERLDSGKARCIICKNVYSYKSTTSNLKNHLRRKHMPANASVSRNSSSPVCIITSETPIEIDAPPSLGDEGDVKVPPATVVLAGKRSFSADGESSDTMLRQKTLKRPRADADSDPDLNFFASLLPDVRCMSPIQKRQLKMGVLRLIDEILT